MFPTINFGQWDLSRIVVGQFPSIKASVTFASYSCSLPSYGLEMGRLWKCGPSTAEEPGSLPTLQSATTGADYCDKVLPTVSHYFGVSSHHQKPNLDYRVSLQKLRKWTLHKGGENYHGFPNPGVFLWCY